MNELNYPAMVLERPGTSSRIKVPFSDISHEVNIIIRNWLIAGNEPNPYLQEWVADIVKNWLHEHYPNWIYVETHAFAR